MLVQVWAGFLAGVALGAAADIRGWILIERKLTRYNVTASAGMYQRGASIPLGENPEDDPIAFERSHVVVYLDGPGQATPVLAAIEQRNRRFVPDLVVVAAGSTVSFPNFDPIFHNVFSLSSTKTFDLGNYASGRSAVVTFARSGIVVAYCHFHPNMVASIVVTPNDWGTRVARDGSFVLKGVPAGTHTLVAWHKTAGTFRKKVTVDTGGEAVVEFVLPYVDPSGRKAIAPR